MTGFQVLVQLGFRSCGCIRIEDGMVCERQFRRGRPAQLSAQGASGFRGGLGRWSSRKVHAVVTSPVAAFLVRMACGASVRTVGFQPGAGPCVYFSNHTSHLDALVIWAALPPGIRKRTRPVAAGDYWRGGPIRRWLAGRVFNALLVERLRVTARNNPVNQFQEVVDAGDSLILFPEGTRSATGEIGLVKGGLYHLAVRRPELDLVPVHIDNLNRILPRGEFFPVPLLSCVILGHAMRLNPSESKQDFLERTRRAVIELKSE